MLPLGQGCCWLGTTAPSQGWLPPWPHCPTGLPPTGQETCSCSGLRQGLAQWECRRQQPPAPGTDVLQASICLRAACIGEARLLGAKVGGRAARTPGLFSWARTSAALPAPAAGQQVDVLLVRVCCAYARQGARPGLPSGLPGRSSPCPRRCGRRAALAGCSGCQAPGSTGKRRRPGSPGALMALQPAAGPPHSPGSHRARAGAASLWAFAAPSSAPPCSDHSRFCARKMLLPAGRVPVGRPPAAGWLRPRDGPITQVRRPHGRAAVREAGADDLEQLAWLARECGADWTRPSLQAGLCREGGRVLVACCAPGCQAVGACIAWLVLDELQLLDLFVQPGHRRLGHGAALLSAVLSRRVCWSTPTLVAPAWAGSEACLAAARTRLQSLRWRRAIRLLSRCTAPMALR